MRLANVAGRATIVTGDHIGIDVASASDGVFGPSLPDVLSRWSDFRAWAARRAFTGGVAFARRDLLPPSPAPSQIVAVGLNYHAHAAETGFDAPSGLPPIFTKFASALTGAEAVVELPPGGKTDWEVELVVVIGAGGRNIPAERAWESVAGVTVGQDLSERDTQMAGVSPQFSLGKSFARFAPIGPWLVTPDELADPDDLALECVLDGETVQSGRTSQMIFGVRELIARISEIIELRPGDVVFTGTPDGVGMGRTPPRYLASGVRLVSSIEGVGSISQTFVGARP